MDSNNYIVPLSTILGVIFGFFFRMLWERRINKVIKHDEIVLNNEIDNLKEKLSIYWTIYFKLLICLSAKLQIKKIRETSNELINMIQMENDVIITNLEEIVSIITKNTQKMDMDDYLLDLILRFISHVLAYKCLRQLNIKKLPSEYGFPFPDEFTQEITRRTLIIQTKYDEYLGNKYDSKKFKGIDYLNISLNNTPENNFSRKGIKRNNTINLEFQKKLKEIHIKTNTAINNNEKNQVVFEKKISSSNDENDLISIDPDDINLEDVFIFTYQNKNELNNDVNTTIIQNNLINLKNVENIKPKTNNTELETMNNNIFKSAFEQLRMFIGQSDKSKTTSKPINEIKGDVEIVNMPYILNEYGSYEI